METTLNISRTGSYNSLYYAGFYGTGSMKEFQDIRPWNVPPEPKLAEKFEFNQPTNLTDEQVLEIEKKIFEQKKEELLKDYEGKYIALINGLVVDSDIDFSELAKKVYATYGYKAIFITRVIRNEKSHKISSPKFKSTEDI